MERPLGRALTLAAACAALCVVVCTGAVLCVAAGTKRVKTDAGAFRTPDASTHQTHSTSPHHYVLVLVLGCLAAAACAT